MELADHLTWMLAAVYVVCIYSTLWFLTWLVPGRTCKGHAKDSDGKPLMYKINGLQCAVLTLLLHALVLNSVPGLSHDFLIMHYMKVATVACWFGILLSVVLHFIGDKWPGHVTAHSGQRSSLASFYLGAEMNPRPMGVDLKMWLYVAGATMVILNIGSAVSLYHKQHGALHPLLIIYALEMLWFCFDYLVFEYVHLSTYDLFAENVGFKLAWGSVCFYPFFYPIGVMPFASPLVTTIQLSWLQLIASPVIFLLGWFLSRGANMQKYSFKTAVIRGSQTFFSIRQEAIAVSTTLPLLQSKK